MDKIMAIAITEARESCKGDMPLVDRVTKAMDATKDHWMATDDVVRFKSAVGAAMLESPPKDRERLEEEMRALNHMSALMSGINVSFDNIPMPENPIGLIGLWAQVKG